MFLFLHRYCLFLVFWVFLCPQILFASPLDNAIERVQILGILEYELNQSTLSRKFVDHIEKTLKFEEDKKYFKTLVQKWNKDKKNWKVESFWNNLQLKKNGQSVASYYLVKTDPLTIVANGRTKTFNRTESFVSQTREKTKAQNSWFKGNSFISAFSNFFTMPQAEAATQKETEAQQVETKDVNMIIAYMAADPKAAKKLFKPQSYRQWFWGTGTLPVKCEGLKKDKSLEPIEVMDFNTNQNSINLKIPTANFQIIGLSKDTSEGEIKKHATLWCANVSKAETQKCQDDFETKLATIQAGLYDEDTAASVTFVGATRDRIDEVSLLMRKARLTSDLQEREKILKQVASELDSMANIDRLDGSIKARFRNESAVAKSAAAGDETAFRSLETSVHDFEGSQITYSNNELRRFAILSAIRCCSSQPCIERLRHDSGDYDGDQIKLEPEEQKAVQ